MAPSATGNRFTSVNLNKNYGGKASSSAGASMAAAASARSRPPQNQQGMLVLSRPLRSQSSSSSSGLKSLKLTVPRPLNLPSLRKEHSGNDPNVTLVVAGTSGSSGWSKQPLDNAVSPAVVNDALSSSPSRTDSSWRSLPPDLTRHGELSSSSPHILPAALSQSLTINTSEAVIVLRGEDFPTLRASLPPPPSSSSSSLASSQQQQRKKEEPHPGKHDKFLLERTEHLSATSQPSAPQLQPSHSIHHSKFNQLICSSSNDTPSSEQNSASSQLNGCHKKPNGFFPGPAPLIRLHHTSNWTDDERETLHISRSELQRGERDHVHNRSRTAAPFSFDQRDKYRGGPSALSGERLHPNYAKDEDFMQSLHIGKISSFTLDGWNGRVGGVNTSLPKESYNHKASLINRDGRDSLVTLEGSSGNSKGGWGSVKSSLSRMDASINRSTVSNRDSQVDGKYKRVGSLGSGRAVYQKDSPVRDVLSNSRDGYFQDGGFGSESVRRSSDREKNYHFQTDRFARFQQHTDVNTGKGSSFVGPRSQHTIRRDFGRDRWQICAGNPSRQGITELPHLDLGFNSRISVEHASKVLRKKKDAAKEIFRDPERESFEAELEKVQKMMEQEKQRIAEERERAIELVRKEREERERAAREEEERQRKLEQEAKDAALREERKIAEEAQKLEQERRLREEEKRRFAMEEERRKEAARQKLKELEERIAKRENEKKREAQQFRVEEKAYVGRPIDNDERIPGGIRRGKKSEHQEEEELFNTMPGLDLGDDRAPFRFSRPPYSSVREVSNGENLKGRHLDTGIQSDAKSGYEVLSEWPKDASAWRKDSMDHGGNILSRDGSLSNRQCENLRRSFSPRDSVYGSQRRMPHFEEEDTFISILSKDHNHLHEPRLNSKSGLHSSGIHFRSDIDPVYDDSAYERDVDRNWTRNNQRMVEEGYRVTSPSLHSYLRGNDVIDTLPLGRSRQFLPKQPRVLPPPPQMVVQKTVQRTDNAMHLSAKLCEDNIKVLRSGSNTQEDEDAEAPAETMDHESLDDEEEPINAQDKDNLHGNQLATQVMTVCQLDCMVEPDVPLQLSELESNGSIVLDTESPSDMQSENTFPEAQNIAAISLMEATKEDANARSRVGNEIVFESEILEESAGSKMEVPVSGNLEQDLALELEEDLREAHMEEAVDSGYDGTAEQVLENHGFDSSKNKGDNKDGIKEIEEVVMMPNNQKIEEEVINSELLGEPDSQVIDSVEGIVKSEAHSMESTNVSQHPGETLQALAEPPIQEGSFPINAVDLAHLREADVFSSRQSLVQQFQKPFSFMAMPLLHSNASSTTSQHPFELAPFPGFQNQPELPFQLQLGLFPGTPLLPNAIQIGSIQMPLNLHHQMPQLAHMHSSQTPVFQFGQIIDTHSAPPSQPLPVMQPAVQVQHPLCQIAVNQPSHSYQAQTLQCSEDSFHFTPTNAGPIIGQISDHDVLSSQNSCLGPVGHKSTLKASNHVEAASTSALNPGMESEFPNKIVVSQQADLANNGCKFQKNVVVRRTFKEVSSDAPVVPSDSTCMAVNRVQSNDEFVLQSNGMPYSGRRRGGGARQGFFGQGRGRYFSGKAYDGTSIASEPNMRLEAGRLGGYNQIRPGRRNFPRSEFRVKDLESQTDSTLAHSLSVGTRRTVRERSHCTSSDVVSSFDNKGDMDGQAHSITLTGMCQRNNGGQNIDVPVSRYLQNMRKNWPSSATSEKNFLASASSGSRSVNGIPKKYMGLEASDDVASQRGVVCVFEQPGIETLEDENDFIEVRSKRQMLNDRREQREKENKAKSKDMKVKEHVIQKPQRLPVKAIRQSELSIPVSSKPSSNQMVERQLPFSKINVEAAGNEKRPTLHTQDSGASPTFLSSGVNASSQLLAPIGTPANYLPDMPKDRWTRSPKQMLNKSSSNASLNGSSTVEPVTSVIQGSCPCTTIAWGGQRSSPQLQASSFSKMQLEEIVKPGNFGTSSPQQLSLSERDRMMLEPGKPLPLSSEVSTTLPEPVGSLLSEQDIKFGAVTVPTLVSDALGLRVEPETDRVSDVKSQAIPTTRHLVMQVSGIDDSVSIPLPADLSIENSLLFHGAMSQGSTGYMLPPVLGGPPAFPHLEMGNMLGGPIFALAPREDTLSIAHGPNEPSSSLEPGHPATGPGGIGAWQQRRVGGMMDSFYGSPAGFTAPFINPTGSISSVQGPSPHMVFYTNPFTPVGQFGQLGVSFMGPAYIPSGKQPDWKHNPATTSSSGRVDGERMASLSGTIAAQHVAGMPNIMQNSAPGGPSIMSAASPLNLFDSSTFQSQWCNGSNQYLNIPVSRPLVGLTMQPYYPSSLPNQTGSLLQIMETSVYPPLSVSKPAGSTPFQYPDAVGQFPRELGLVDSLLPHTSFLTGIGQRPSSGEHVRKLITSTTTRPFRDNLQQVHTSHTTAESSESFKESGTMSVMSESCLGLLVGQSASGKPSLPHFQAQNFNQPIAAGLPHSHPLSYVLQRSASDPGARTVNIENDWFGGHIRGGTSGRMQVSEGRQPGERSFSSSKLRQVSVAKPSQSQNAAGQDCYACDSGTGIFNNEEVSEATIDC